jgi:hypothetical protein
MKKWSSYRTDGQANDKALQNPHIHQVADKACSRKFALMTGLTPVSPIRLAELWLSDPRVDVQPSRYRLQVE